MSDKKPTVRVMLKDAVKALGGKTTHRQIIDWINGKYNDVNEGTIRAHINMSSVNMPGRVGMPENAKPRSIIDERYDFLFSIGRGEVEFYNPTKHGKWSLMETHNGKTVIAKDGIPISDSSESPLLKFVRDEMQMNANYQPIVIKMLLENEDKGFAVSYDDIKKKFDDLNFDAERFKKGKRSIGSFSSSIDSVEGALKRFVTFPPGASKGKPALKQKQFNHSEIPEILKICGQEIARWHINKIAKNDFRLWRVKPGTEEEGWMYLDEFLETNSLGVGWNGLGDLSGFESEDDVNDHIDKVKPVFNSKSSVTAISHKMSEKDLVVVTKAQKELVDYGIIVSKYEFEDKGKGSYAHRRRVVWLSQGPVLKRDFPDEHFGGSLQAAHEVHDPAKKKFIDFLLGEKYQEYFLLRYNGDDEGDDENAWNDKLGERYHIGRKENGDYGNNVKRILDAGAGTKTVWWNTKKGTCFWGYGIVSKIETVNEDKDWNLLYDDFELFEGDVDIRGRKLKQASEYIDQQIHLVEKEAKDPGFNWQQSINIIPKRLYEEITGNRSTMATSQEQDTAELERLYQILERKKQIILYGPPGTGKTFCANELRDYILSKNSVEPPKTTFKNAAIKILEENNGPLNYAEIIERALEQNLISTKGETPQFTLLKIMSEDVRLSGENAIFKKIEKGIYGLNKTTQTKNIDEYSFSKNITFHQSYSYEDFVEGIRPKVTEDNKVIYVRVDGIFKEISDDARDDPDNKYVLVIDEINRGKTEKIFGELITLIEDDKRIESQKTTLPYSKDPFWVPKNLFIIGTMNTADRSIAIIDTAFRRRFAFEELMPKPELVDKEIDGISLKALLEELNNRIRAEGNALREKQIGHSYFMNVKNLSELRITFAVEIVPLLQDYFYHDYKKLEESILNSDFIDSEQMVIKEKWKKDDASFKAAINKILGQ